MAINVFLSYSHADESLRKQVETQLSMLKRQGVIETWHDRRIGAGTEFAAAIDEHVQSDHIILLLVSADFLASDYCVDIEMKRAMERHEAGQAIVIPVILRACEWHEAPFRKLTATPPNGKPIMQYADRDEALLEVARAVREAAGRFHRQGGGGGGGSEGPPNPGIVAAQLSDASREVLNAASHTRNGNVYYSAVYPESLDVGDRQFIQVDNVGSARKWGRVIAELLAVHCLEKEGVDDVTQTAILKITTFGLDVAEIAEAM